MSNVQVELKARLPDALDVIVGSALSALYRAGLTARSCYLFSRLLHHHGQRSLASGLPNDQFIIGRSSKGPVFLGSVIPALVFLDFKTTWDSFLHVKGVLVSESSGGTHLTTSPIVEFLVPCFSTVSNL